MKFTPWADEGGSGRIIDGEQRLWQQVLLRAVEDALGPVAACNRPEQGKARSWLTEPGFREDRSLICSLAGIELDALEDWAQNMQTERWTPVGGDD